MRRAVLAEGFGFDLAEPVRVELKRAGTTIEMATSVARLSIEGEGLVRIEIQPDDSAPSPGVAVVLEAPDAIEWIGSAEGRLEGGAETAALEFGFRVVEPSRRRFAIFTAHLTIGQEERYEIPLVLQLDR